MPVNWGPGGWFIGQGACGDVVAADTESHTGGRVAVKRVANATAHTRDATRTLREVQLLRQLSHENIVPLLGVQTLRHRSGIDALLVYQLMDTDLHQIVRSNQLLYESHAQFFVYQALRALKYIHSAGVLHRDLKPANMLLNANCDLKICDFGLSRLQSAPPQIEAQPTALPPMTEYVVTRWYRAPELLLNCTEYGPPIDVWSVGCVLAEVLLRTPLLPGRNHKEQLSLITRLTGTPSSESQLKFVPTESAKQFVMGLPARDRADFSSVLPNSSSNAADLVDKMLAFNPSERIGVDDALSHPFFERLHDPADEPASEQLARVDDQVSSPAEAASKLLDEASAFPPQWNVAPSCWPYRDGFEQQLQSQNSADEPAPEAKGRRKYDQADGPPTTATTTSTEPSVSTGERTRAPYVGEQSHDCSPPAAPKSTHVDEVQQSLRAKHKKAIAVEQTDELSHKESCAMRRYKRKHAALSSDVSSAAKRTNRRKQRQHVFN